MITGSTPPDGVTIHLYHKSCAGGDTPTDVKAEDQEEGKLTPLSVGPACLGQLLAVFTERALAPKVSPHVKGLDEPHTSFVLGGGVISSTVITLVSLSVAVVFSTVYS
jgi:hypothetical protein